MRKIRRDIGISFGSIISCVFADKKTKWFSFGITVRTTYIYGSGMCANSAPV